MSRFTALLFALALLPLGRVASAGDLIQSPTGGSLTADRGMDVEADLQNEDAPFSVRVAVDREDRTYEKGELMHVAAKSQRDGYLYLMYKQADGSTKCLFPNLYRSDNRIRGGQAIVVPAEGQGFKLRCNSPLGDELLVAIVSQQPLAVERLGVGSLTKSVTTDIDLETFVRRLRDEKGMDVEGDLPAATSPQWAEHSVRIKTVDVGSRGAAKPQSLRIGVFIGISDYLDEAIRDLHICHKDAGVMAVAMEKYGHLDGVVLLTNEKATLANIKQVFRELKLKTRPGDEIFIYWSGHGASCADTSGDEDDGRDEFLIPYDGRVDDVAGTMVLDDALGRWIQELDGRKVCIILDACHSGGQATGKGLGGSAKGAAKITAAIGKTPAASIDQTPETAVAQSNPEPTYFKGLGCLGAVDRAAPGGDGRDFFDSELRRIKDIGQKDATILCSSASDEISAERRDGTLSVMTYFLVMKLDESHSLTVKEAYDHVRVEVPKYMREHFPTWKQTPQLCPRDGAAPIRLR